MEKRFISKVKNDKNGKHIEKCMVRYELSDSKEVEFYRVIVVDQIMKQESDFYTVVDDKLGAKVGVYKVDGENFLKTKPNNRAEDNLDNLPVYY